MVTQLQSFGPDEWGKAACRNESAERVDPTGLLPIDLSSKCSLLQAQLLSNRPRPQQLQYLPEHGLHHIQVPGDDGGRLRGARMPWGLPNNLVHSLRCRKSRARQRQETLEYLRLKNQGVSL